MSSSSSSSCALSPSHYHHYTSERPPPHHSRLRSSRFLSLSSCSPAGHSPRYNEGKRRRYWLASPVAGRRTRERGEGSIPGQSPSLPTCFFAFSPLSVRPSPSNSVSCIYTASSSFCSSSTSELGSFLHASTSWRPNPFSSSRGSRLSSSSSCSPPTSSSTSTSSSSVETRLPSKPSRFLSLCPSCGSFSPFSSSHSIHREHPGPTDDGGRRAGEEEEDGKERSTCSFEKTGWSIEKRTETEKKKKKKKTKGGTVGEFACSSSSSPTTSRCLSDEE